MRKAWSSTYYKRITIQTASTIRAGRSIYNHSLSPLSNAIATSLRCFSAQTHKAANIPETSRTLPTAGFRVIQTNQLIEEEELPDYKPDRFYPIKLGEIFQGRYQAIAKLGFGTSSATWLARDLRGRQYVALRPPPAEFLARNRERRAAFWSEKGEWLDLAPIPYGRTMEALETRLEDKSGFLRFVGRTLTWLPGNRPTAGELLQDPWLMGGKVSSQ